MKSIIWFGKYELFKTLSKKIQDNDLDLKVVGKGGDIVKLNLGTMPISIITPNVNHIHYIVWKIFDGGGIHFLLFLLFLDYNTF